MLEISANDNVTTGEPWEVLQYVNYGLYGINFNIVITYDDYDSPGPPATLMKAVFYGNSSTINEYETHSATVVGHANGAGAEAVGAAFYLDTPEYGTTPPLLESFSSAGGTPIIFDTDGQSLPVPEVRLKPEIVAIDGVNTTFFYSDSYGGDGIPDFFGTSAAAPHAAGVAALMLQAKEGATPAQINAALESSAVDMGVAGFDYDTGYGLIQADAAIAAILASGNTSPIADFEYIVSSLNVNFTDLSSDSDGSIVAWSWDFGDGITSGTQNPLHPYAAAGSYIATLTVTDNDGGKNATSQSVTVSAGSVNSPPVASFTYDCIDKICSFNGANSRDDDGLINSYLWDFGDNSTSSQTDTSTSHPYSVSGTYQVTLTVMDDEGATDTATQEVTVSDPDEISAPVGLTAFVNRNTVNLTWEDTSSNEEGFSVEYAKKIRGKYLFAVIDLTAAADATNYQDIGVSPGTYKYRVRSFAGNTFSEYSNEVLVKVEETTLISICGDGTCDPDETVDSCPADCSTDLRPKGSLCDSDDQCQSGSCHPIKLTCK